MSRFDHNYCRPSSSSSPSSPSSCSPSSISSSTNVYTNDKSIEEECRQLFCGICSSIMIFPVTLPCNHQMCLQCFKLSKEEVSLLCPFCRKRYSCWARKAKNKDQELIDWKKWEVIQTKFPDLVRIRTSENDWSDVFDEQIFGQTVVPRVISREGEIRQEFEELSRKERERLLSEEKASEALIQQILLEDNKQIEETANDQQMARIVDNQINPPKEVNIKTLRNRSYLSQ